MYLESFVLANSPPSYANLSLFICHLFVGGNFSNTRILYQPRVFDDRLIQELESTCSAPIPILTTDVTRIKEREWKSCPTTPNTLRLFFVRRKELKSRSIATQQIGHSFPIYVFLNIRGSGLDRLFTDVAKDFYVANAVSMALLLFHKDDGSVLPYHYIHPRNITHIDIPNPIFDTKVFDYSLRKNSPQKAKAISSFSTINCNDKNHAFSHLLQTSRGFVANFYYTQMNWSLLLDMITNCRVKFRTETYLKLGRHIHKAIYNELSFDSEPVYGGSM